MRSLRRCSVGSRSLPSCRFSTEHSPPSVPLVRLGLSSLRVSQVGLGTWQWGEKNYWGYGKQFTFDDCEAAWKVSRARGINFIDTAEAYKSEQIIASLMQSAESSPATPLVLASKYAPWPTRIKSKNIETALNASLARLNVPSIDLYQMHFPWGLVGMNSAMNILADQVEAGRIKAVGVSNYSAKQTEAAHSALAKRGLHLVSNQMEYSLLNRTIETNGVMEICKSLNVSVIAYSPLAQGALSGKYHAIGATPVIGMRRYMRPFRRSALTASAPLIKAMQEIGQRHGRTVSQVALNWLIQRGTIPIPGAKSAAQAEENAGAAGWALNAEEMDRLSAPLPK